MAYGGMMRKVKDIISEMAEIVNRKTDKGTKKVIESIPEKPPKKESFVRKLLGNMGEDRVKEEQVKETPVVETKKNTLPEPTLAAQLLSECNNKKHKKPKPNGITKWLVEEDTEYETDVEIEVEDEETEEEIVEVTEVQQSIIPKFHAISKAAGHMSNNTTPTQESPITGQVKVSARTINIPIGED
jgi:hypothetical protein